MESKQPRTLPDELVEKIICMVPFPLITKARGLSKKWRARFSAVSSLEDEETRRDAEEFQLQVQETATSWSTFFPVCMDGDFFCGYDRASQKWVRFPYPSMACLPREFPTIATYQWIEGALLFRVIWDSHCEGELYVANLLTQSWKKSGKILPSDIVTNDWNPVSLWDSALETYKVFYMQQDHDNRWCAQIYDTKSDRWTTECLYNEDEKLGIYPVHLNGVLYTTYGQWHIINGISPMACLLALDMADGSLREISLHFEGVIEDIDTVKLVVCNGKLYMILAEYPRDMPIRVLEVDLQWLALVEVATAPVSLSQGGARGIHEYKEPVSHGDCIFFSTAEIDPTNCYPQEKVPGTMVAYDVKTKEWTVLDFASKMTTAFKWGRKGPSMCRRNLKWLPSSFRPGLNPFAEV